MERKRIDHPRRVFKVCLALAQAQGEVPAVRGRGHPPVYEEALYLGLLLFRAYFHLTFRATVAFYQALLPDRPCPSFQALHWFLRRKASPESLEGLFQRLKERLAPLLPQEGEFLFILDSTGLPHRGITQRLRWEREVKGHSRLCAFIRYFRGARLLVLDNCASICHGLTSGKVVATGGVVTPRLRHCTQWSSLRFPHP